MLTPCLHILPQRWEVSDILASTCLQIKTVFVFKSRVVLRWGRARGRSQCKILSKQNCQNKWNALDGKLVLGMKRADELGVL